MTMQLNSQLMPVARRRHVGVGASAVTLQPGDFFKMSIDISQGGNPALAIPANLNASGFGGNFSGRYTGTTPYRLYPGNFVYLDTAQNRLYSYDVLSASVTPSAPIVFQGPPAPVYTAVNTPLSTSTNGSSVDPSLGATTYGAGVFTFVPGHRIQSTATASGGAMPASFSGMTVASMQALVDPTQFKVVSVSYPSPLTMSVVYDYTGPSKTIGSPVTFAAGAVTMKTTYMDQGPSPSAASSSSKTLYYVAGAGVLSAAAIAAYMKWGRK
jgi:hypothetical protein